MTLIKDILKGLNLKPAEPTGVAFQTETSNTTTLTTGTTGLTIRCLRCATDIPMVNFHTVQETCVKSKCFMKKDQAREVAAELLHINPEDMLPVVSGKLAIHQEFGTVYKAVPQGVVD